MSAENEGAKLTVPKFSSFKSQGETPKEIKPPKFSSFKPQRAESSLGGSEEEPQPDRDRDSRKRSRCSHSDRSERRHHGAKHPRHGSRERHRRHERKESPSLGKASDVRLVAKSAAIGKQGEPGLYVIDVKGDPLITKYGGIDRSQIPAYYRHGSGRVLGTDGRLVIHRDGPRDQFSLRMPGEGSAAFTDKKGLRSKSWRVRSKPVRIRTQAAEEAQDAKDEDFLEIRRAKKQRRDSDSSDDEQPSYRSIEGKAKAHQFSDSDLDYGSESADEEILEADQNNPLRWKSIQLSQRVKESPEDIDAWLELVAHQDSLLRAGEDIDHRAQEAAVHSYTEIKLDMLEKALSNVASSQDRERVLVSLMREGCKVWNSKTTAKRWTELTRDEEQSFALWRTHLDFVVSNIATFHYDDVKSFHLQRMGQVTTRQPSRNLLLNFREAIYIFLRLTRFIHDAGYKELAVAAWQGVLELNCFRPAAVETRESAMASFQDFWESEVPRIGEANAQGWNSFVESDGAGDPPEPIRHEAMEEGASQSRDAYKTWAFLERAHAGCSDMPARTMDEGMEDDPFRVVMFSDIEPLIFWIPPQLLPEITQQLLDAFLIFCQQPPAYLTDEWTKEAFHDQFLVGKEAWLGSLESGQRPEDSFDDDGEIQKKTPAFNFGGVHTACSPDVLFAGEKWFSYILKDSTGVALLPFLINTAKQIVHAGKIQSFAQYYLALCAIQVDANIKKPAKALLKQFPSDMGLYNAYALAEYANKQPDVATKVLLSATELASSTSSHSAVLLWRSWSWIELEAGNKKLAIKRLCSSCDKALGKSEDTIEASSTLILKTRQAFLSGIDTYCSMGHLDLAAADAEGFVLLSYLTADGCSEPMSPAQGNISAAMAAVQQVSAEFKRHGDEATPDHERVLQFAARLLYLNASRGPFRRAYLLECLAGFNTFFPRNTIFLSLFEWADASLRVIDEVRTLLHEKVLISTQDCVSSRMFAIQHEIQRGNNNTAKAAFEHAVSSDACKFNGPLWVAYIRFCSSRKELRPKAKDVFFRAMRHSPGSKDGMMAAFVTLNRDMESSELRSVFNTMTTKGLRVHVDLEEYLEKKREERRHKTQK